MIKVVRENIRPFLSGRGWGTVLMWVVLLGVVTVSCKDNESYAEQKEKERKAITALVARSPLILVGNNSDTLLNIPRMNVITREQFEAQDSMTDASKDEFVLFANTGIYMQIVRKGPGEKMKSGDNKRIICRYWEYNIMGDSLKSSNRLLYWMTNPEIMDVSNNSGTFTASFNTTVNGGGAMYRLYNSTAVPSGWIVPLSYINIGRQTTPDEGIALVRLIVPHSQGTTDATNNVYPCFYEISYEEMRD